MRKLILFILFLFPQGVYPERKRGVYSTGTASAGAEGFGGILGGIMAADEINVQRQELDIRHQKLELYEQKMDVEVGVLRRENLEYFVCNFSAAFLDGKTHDQIWAMDNRIAASKAVSYAIQTSPQVVEDFFSGMSPQTLDSFLTWVDLNWSGHSPGNRSPIRY